MSTYLAEAIEIITDDGRGIVTGYSNTGIGLASDGHFYLITDRHGLNGAKTITGDTTRTVWYEGILTRDDWSLPSSRCDFVEAGNLESVSGFSFSIKNTGGFFSTLASNGVYLSRRRVKYYRVTSTDGTTFNFELRWSGVVDEQPFNELSYSIQCVSTVKDVFKTLPPASLNDSIFTEAPSESRDKAIPIAIGRTAYSPLVNVRAGGEKTVLCVVGGESHTVAAATDYVDTTDVVIDLYTPGIRFAENDLRLVGKFLRVIAVGDPQYRKIIGNLETGALGGGSFAVDVTTLTLSDALTGTPGLLPSLISTVKTVWYFEVVDLGATLIASEKPVYEMLSGINGRKILATYSSDRKAYDSVSELGFLASATNIATTGYPGYSAIAKAASDDGELLGYFPVVPESAALVSVTSPTSTVMTTSLAVGDDMPSVLDQDESTYYTFSGSGTWLRVRLDVTLADENTFKEYDQLSVLLAFAHSFASGLGVTVQVTVDAYDVYDRNVATSISSETIYDDLVGASDSVVTLLPRLYFNQADDKDADGDFYFFKGALDISDDYNTSGYAVAFKRLRITLDFSPDALGTYAFKLREVGLVGKRTISVTSETLYAGIRGETFGTTWDGRKTGTIPIDTAIEALEHLVRNYDTSAPIWQAGKAYVVGDQVRGTADTGHIFVCTTAGTSHASTEPTWTDTAGATYSDGSAAWKEFQEIPVDKTTFDAANAQRTAWRVGRTLVDRKPSEDYYRELLAQSFLIGCMDKNGNLKVKAWRENTAALAAFDSTNIIEGSIFDMSLSPMSKMYNDITINYDWSPGGGKFNKRITVTNADKPAFPSSTEVANVIGTSLGSFSISNLSYYGIQTFTIVTSSPHGLLTGDIVSLIGNTHGYDFTLSPVSVVDANTLSLFTTGHIITTTPSTTGTLYKYTSANLKWKTYVTGIDNYATAQDLWEQCHASYLITKTIRKLPENLSNCYWFPDPYALDPNGDRLWDLDVGDEHAAYLYAWNLVNWAAWQKKQTVFEVLDNSTYSAREIGDRVTFNDAKLTGGVALPGWIHEKTQLARTATLPERLRFGVTLLPEALVDTLYIEEDGATDIIDESGGTNIYEEYGA